MLKKFFAFLAALCLVIGCLLIYKNFFNITNPFFDTDVLEKNKYYGTIMQNDEIIEGDFAIKIERVSGYNNGYIYKLELNKTDKTQQGNTDDFLLGYFYVCENKIVKMNDDLQEIATVCQEESIKDNLSEEELGWHSSLQYSGEECSYTSYNNRVETGFYESMIWNKQEGLKYYRRGFGAGADSVEISLQN